MRAGESEEKGERGEGRVRAGESEEKGERGRGESEWREE